MWQPYISAVANYFPAAKHCFDNFYAIETVANNARTERLNGAIQELKTIVRGYKNIENFRIAILFFYGDFKMAPH